MKIALAVVVTTRPSTAEGLQEFGLLNPERTIVVNINQKTHLGVLTSNTLRKMLV